MVFNHLVVTTEFKPQYTQGFRCRCPMAKFVFATFSYLLALPFSPCTWLIDSSVFRRDLNSFIQRFDHCMWCMSIWYQHCWILAMLWVAIMPCTMLALSSSKVAIDRITWCKRNVFLSQEAGPLMPIVFRNVGEPQDILLPNSLGSLLSVFRKIEWWLFICLLDWMFHRCLDDSQSSFDKLFLLLGHRHAESSVYETFDSLNVPEFGISCLWELTEWLADHFTIVLGPRIHQSGQVQLRGGHQTFQQQKRFKVQFYRLYLDDTYPQAFRSTVPKVWLYQHFSSTLGPCLENQRRFLTSRTSVEQIQHWATIGLMEVRDGWRVSEL